MKGQPAASSLGGWSFGCELSSRAIVTNSQLVQANDLNPGRISQSRISPPQFLQVIACPVRTLDPSEFDDWQAQHVNAHQASECRQRSMGEPHRGQVSMRPALAGVKPQWLDLKSAVAGFQIFKSVGSGSDCSCKKCNLRYFHPHKSKNWFITTSGEGQHATQGAQCGRM
jgi:hypothetical protein